MPDSDRFITDSTVGKHRIDYNPLFREKIRSNSVTCVINLNLLTVVTQAIGLTH